MISLHNLLLMAISSRSTSCLRLYVTRMLMHQNQVIELFDSLEVRKETQRYYWHAMKILLAVDKITGSPTYMS